MTMRHRGCRLGIAMCVLAAGTSAQDLKGNWERIQAEFLGGLHDSVVVHVRPFIAELEKRDLKAQLSVAYFHYAVSLAQLGKEFQADSCFELSKSIARSAALPEKAKEIEQKQIQLYLSLAKQSEKKDLQKAVEHYGKAIAKLSGGEDARTLVGAYYQRGALFRSLNESERAMKDFEAAMDLNSRPGGDQNLRSSLVSVLTELYLNTGNTEKAARLAGGANRSRIEYTIKLAAEAEGRGEFGKADEYLRSVQGEIVMTKDDARIVEFLKKRYSLYEHQGLSDAAFDTLRTLLSVLEGLAISPAVRFQGEQILVLLHVQRGQIKEAGKRVERMKGLVAGGMLPAEFGGQIERTQGDVAYLQGDNQEAIQHYRRALSMPAAFEEPVKLSLLNNLGLALARDGQDEEALKLFERMHTQAKDLKLLTYESQADLNGGLVLIKLDLIQEATGRFQRARETAVRTKDPTLQIMASMRLAESFRRSGFENLANDMFEEVRAHQASLTNPLSRIQVLQALALNAKIAGNKYTALLRLKEAYELAGRAGATGFLATLAIDLGDTYFFIDSLDRAKEMYREALRYYEGSGDLGAIVEQQYKLGQCHLTGGEYEPARREILKGLAQLVDGTVKDYGNVNPATVKDVDLFGQGLANAGFVDFTEGRERRDVRKLLNALQLVQKSVEVLEARKGSVLTGTQKESEAVKNVNAYRLLVDVASALFGATGDEQYFGLAFDMSEKSRAASFVSEVGSQLITKLHDPKVKELAEATSRLIEEGRNRPEALTLDLTSPGQGTRGIGAKGDGSRTDEKTRSQYEKIVTRLSAENNKAAQLVTVNTLTLSSVRSLLLENEVLVNYYVSIDKLYALGVSTSGVIMKTIQWTPEDVSGKVEAYRAAVHDLQRNDYAVLGQELYDSLIAPLGTFIAGKRLIAIPSGRLINLPFAGLQNKGEFLAERHEISVLPNASTLQFVRKEKKLHGAPSVFALGNPDNPRVSRLPGAEKEVEQVKSIYPRSLIHFGEQATETIAKEQMGGFDIIHIACHGLFNYDYPYLSSLVLTPDSHNDGFLEVHELYNLNLTNANLVVLSACETGLSQIKKNDDVIGFVRGFLYSGVPSMVASLWKVDDQATAALMSNFHLLLKLGNSKSDALRKAQLQLIRTPATRHPFYWAAFVLYGSAL